MSCKTKTDRDEERRTKWALLCDMGMPLFPDGMISKALATSSFVGSGTYGSCHKITVYWKQRVVFAVAKIFYNFVSISDAVKEALRYR